MPNKVTPPHHRSYAAGGATYAGLGGHFGVSVGCIHLIVTGKRWKHVGGPIAQKDQRHKNGPKAEQRVEVELIPCE